MQKTGESLRKLKEIRNSKNKNAGISASEKHGTSDDEKIRMQLHIDVLSYIKTVRVCGLTKKMGLMFDIFDIYCRLMNSGWIEKIFQI